MTVNLDKQHRRPVNARWGDGPWRDEPDRLEWRDSATGLPCLIRRGPLGNWCGYVALAPDHPLHGTDYDDLPGDVQCVMHWGATFAGPCMEGDEGTGIICHIVQPGESANVWWVGFDCAHAGDLVPGVEVARTALGMPELLQMDGWPGDVYRTADYVMGVCTNLAAVLGRIRSPLPTMPADNRETVPTVDRRARGRDAGAAPMHHAPALERNVLAKRPDRGD